MTWYLLHRDGKPNENLEKDFLANKDNILGFLDFENGYFKLYQETLKANLIVFYLETDQPHLVDKFKKYFHSTELPVVPRFAHRYEVIAANEKNQRS